MAWQMPGQWNSGVAQMTPDLNMGSYSAEQWAVMQQQNWQQWTQWQQQYSQWQAQYGEKYAQQMQSMQGMGTAPPLPPTNSAPPPAPPPPEKPPPPPHENNQPLFGQANPVTAVGSQTQKLQSGSSNTNSIPTGNTQNWSHGVETRNESSQQGVNTEALKKLAEEERLFDIQFEKWEEEIQKWKRENVNHPDRQAYNEYEQKFETCRAQLLERRQVMNQKRARLLGQPPPTASNNTTGNTPTAVPPPVQATSNNQNLHLQSQSHNSVSGQSSNQNQQLDYSQTNLKPNNQNFINKPIQNYQDNSQYVQYSNQIPPQAGYNRNNNTSKDLQDRFDTYQQSARNEDYISSNTTPSNFLPGTGSTKGIPGLDLVPDDKAGSQQVVIDITDEKPAAAKLPPDYTTISKGINTILGDEKIMNILSMVRDQGVPPVSSSNQAPFVSKPTYNNNNDNYNAPPNNQWERNQNVSNEEYADAPPNINFNRRGPVYKPDPSHELNSQPYPPQRRIVNNRENDISSEPYYDRNTQVSDQNMRPTGPPMRPNMPPPRPLMQDLHGYPKNSEFHSGPQRGPSDSMRLIRPNMPPPKPLMQDMLNREGENNYSRGISGNRPMNNIIRPAMNTPPPLPPPQPARPTWVEEPLFSPSIIVEYEHKPLRLKAREFIEPVHMFDYNHKSKDGDNYKKKDFEREADELFARKPRRLETEDTFKDNRFGADMSRQYSPRDFERRYPREEFREDQRDLRGPPREEYGDRRRLDERVPLREEYDDRRRPDGRGPSREEYDDRRRPDERYDERRRDDRERYSRREDFSRERDREDFGQRDRQKEFRREDNRNRSRSHERDSRKRGRSRESIASENSTTKKSKEPEKKTETPRHVVMIDDLLEPPGREMRPEKIVIILRGPPGSGKSYLAKLIRDREAEHGGTARIMSIDDYFMQEGEIEEKDPVTGKIIKKPSLKYEYEAKSEETYLNSLKRAFKRSLTDGYFTFLIYDAVNDTLRSYADIWNFARQNGFQVYICTMELDSQTCFKRNIHGRTLGDVQVICTRFFPTPDHHIQLDATTLLQSAAITDVDMEDVDDEVIMEDAQEPEVESSFTSKWEKLDDAAQLARLDGTSRPLRASQPSMEDYLQLDDWKPTTAKPGKKTVRWADIEESREQEKMRAIGFVVGQTDWNRMTDPTMGSSALTQTKYIERVKRN